MTEHFIDTKSIKEICPRLSVGDRVFLSGEVFTARDAAMKRIFECLKNGKPLPINIDRSVIYFAGPTPAPDGLAVGSCGPTTSARMDKYTPTLLNMGLAAIIGKGEVNNRVVKAIAENSSIYLCAIGGAGALACRHIKKSEIIAYDDLGCESIKRLLFDNFPLVVGIDTKGKSIFDR